MSTFQHVYDIGQRDVISSLEDNIKSFLDWGFLNIGAFIDVNIPSNSSNVGPAFATVVTDPSVASNTIWETPRKDWVYESGISHSNRSPINISGIYLNNTFLPGPSGSGSYTYSLNYSLGRINFNKPVSSSSKVCLNYSYKYIQTYKANESFWWKEVQNNTYYSNNPDYNISSNHRIQLPAIIIETIPRTVLTPYQLGTSENIITQDILLHIFTENPVQRNSIIDILILQKDKSLYLNNITKILKDNIYSLDYKGQPNSNRLNYNQLQNNSAYFTNKCYINNVFLSELNTFSSSMYNGVVRWSLEIFP
jgi:hypothetical protein